MKYNIEDEEFLFEVEINGETYNGSGAELSFHLNHMLLGDEDKYMSEHAEVSAIIFDVFDKLNEYGKYENKEIALTVFVK